MNTSIQNMNGKFKANYNNGNSKRKFLNENINNIEIEIIKRNYLSDLFNSYTKFNQFNFRPQDKDFNRNKNSNFDYSRLSRTDPQPLFSQNINYNVPTKKFLLNNETNPVSHQNKNSKRKNYKNKPKKNESKNFSTNRVTTIEVENTNEINANLTLITNEKIENSSELKETEEQIKTNVNVQIPVTIDENLIKFDLHKTQPASKKPSSLYENFVKSATKKETNLNKANNVDKLEISLSTLSLSSNETTTSSSKGNGSKLNRPNSIFDNLSSLKKSDSFGNKSLKDSVEETKTFNNSKLKNQDKDQVRKKKVKKPRNKSNKQQHQQQQQQNQAKKSNEDDFDFSNTNEFWEDEEHLVIGHDYLNHDSELDFDLEFDLDKE